MLSFRVFRPAFLLAFACAVAGVLGCGGSSSQAKVSGKVTLKGQAPKMKGLQISFLATNGRMATAQINEDGTFSAEDVPPGEAKVAFLYVNPAAGGATPGKGRSPGVKPGKTETAAKDDQKNNPVPEPLRDGSTSKVTFKVVGGQDNVFNYDIKP